MEPHRSHHPQLGSKYVRGCPFVDAALIDYLVHNEMWLVERKIPLIFRCFRVNFFLPEALWKIVGRYPAFMRPRTLNSSFLLETSNIRKAYGNYNNLVLQASYIRGQVVAVWDFEYVLIVSFYLLWCHFPPLLP
jgi:hypothetical protein